MLVNTQHSLIPQEVKSSNFDMTVVMFVTLLPLFGFDFYAVQACVNNKGGKQKVLGCIRLV